METDNLNEALKFKSFAEKDYKEMELESDNLISMTQEKYNISDIDVINDNLDFFGFTNSSGNHPP